LILSRYISSIFTVQVLVLVYINIQIYSEVPANICDEPYWRGAAGLCLCARVRACAVVPPNIYIYIRHTTYGAYGHILPSPSPDLMVNGRAGPPLPRPPSHSARTRPSAISTPALICCPGSAYSRYCYCCSRGFELYVYTIDTHTHTSTCV